MATKNFRSTVLEPTSEFAKGDKLRFTALATVGEVLKGSFSETTIGEDGVYSVDLQYGKHRIDYKPYEGVWRHFADVEVNADTLATTLQDLALASVPVTDEAVLVLQGILADAEAAKTAAETAETAAETALASIDGKIAEVEAGYPDLFASMIALSTKIYVNKDTGSDANDGKTTSTPVQTLKKAVELARGYTAEIQIMTTGVYTVSENLMCNAVDLSITGNNQNHYPSGAWSAETTTVIEVDKTATIQAGFSLMKRGRLLINMCAITFTGNDVISELNTLIVNPNGGSVNFRIPVFNFDSTNRGVVTSSGSSDGINAVVGLELAFFKGANPRAIVSGLTGTVVVNQRNASNSTGSDINIADSGVTVLG